MVLFILDGFESSSKKNTILALDIPGVPQSIEMMGCSPLSTR
ncbi:MAG: hypothetical protein ACU83P_00310 [Gammaproteobacteria bacterium]